MDPLAKLIDCLILEALSPTERRVRRSRSMGIELEFAANSKASPESVAKKLNKALGTRGLFLPVSKHADVSGKDREFIVSKDFSASHVMSRHTLNKEIEDRSREEAKHIAEFGERYHNLFVDDHMKKIDQNHNEDYEAAIEELTEFLNTSDDHDALNDLSTALGGDGEMDDPLKELYTWSIEAGFGFQSSRRGRPEFDAEEVKGYVENLGHDDLNQVAWLVGFDVWSLKPPMSEKGRADIEDDLRADINWQKAATRYISIRYGRHFAKIFEEDFAQYIRNPNTIKDAIYMFFYQYRENSPWAQDFKDLTQGIEIGSPRIALNDKNISRVAQLFEGIYNALRNDDDIQIRTHDEAGLHVHVGLHDDIEDIHLLRLYYLAAKQEKELERLAGRPTNEWTNSVTFFKENLDKSVEHAIRAGDADFLHDMIRVDAWKMQGKEESRYSVLNLEAVRKIGTIEVRLGSSELVSSGKLEQWLHKINDLFQKAIAEDHLDLDNGYRLLVKGHKIVVQQQSDPNGNYHSVISTTPGYHIKGDDRTPIEGPYTPDYFEDNARGPFANITPTHHQDLRWEKDPELAQKRMRRKIDRRQQKQQKQQDDRPVKEGFLQHILGESTGFNQKKIRTNRLVAPKKKLSEYPKDEMKMGINVEREHTDDDDIAAIIAANHLDEMNDYYTKLSKMEGDKN